MPKSKVRQSSQSQKKHRASKSSKSLKSQRVSMPSCSAKKIQMNWNGQVHEMPAYRISTKRSNPGLVEANSSEAFSVIYALTDANVLNDLRPKTLKLLATVSGQNAPSIALEELFREGAIPAGDSADWLDNRYLGTWEHPDFATGVFLDDLGGFSVLPEGQRREFYSRLAEVVPLTEQVLSNGKVCVSMGANVDQESRWLLNQHVVHGKIPDVITF